MLRTSINFEEVGNLVLVSPDLVAKIPVGRGKLCLCCGISCLEMAIFCWRLVASSIAQIEILIDCLHLLRFRLLLDQMIGFVILMVFSNLSLRYQNSKLTLVDLSCIRPRSHFLHSTYLVSYLSFTLRDREQYFQCYPTWSVVVPAPFSSS